MSSENHHWGQQHCSTIKRFNGTWYFWEENCFPTFFQIGFKHQSARYVDIIEGYFTSKTLTITIDIDIGFDIGIHSQKSLPFAIVAAFIWDCERVLDVLRYRNPNVLFCSTANGPLCESIWYSNLTRISDSSLLGWYNFSVMLFLVLSIFIIFESLLPTISLEA